MVAEKESWLNGKRQIIDQDGLTKWKTVRRKFGCLLCDHQFKVNDGFRFIFANFHDSPFHYGNFFVCDACDAGSKTLLKAAEIVEPLRKFCRTELFERVTRTELE